MSGVYYQILNLGLNVAELVNFEFSNTLDMPMDYVWCKKGTRFCGRYALTENDYQLSDTILIIDLSISSDKDEPAPASIPPYIPIPALDPCEEIKQMIDFIMVHRFQPSWLDCSDP
jgi:hypothetical protein